MPDLEPYPTPSGVQSAIKDAARKAAKADPTLPVSKRISLEHFNRFLSRVFSEGDHSNWVLKGGTGILARVPASRSTRDIDLYRGDSSIQEALADLIRLARTDLQDHFRFEYDGHTETVDADAQPYTVGYRVKFNIFVGVATQGALSVDLVVGAGMTSDVVVAEPATALHLPRLTTHPYRLYPVVDQIADKVCATMSEYGPGATASSREKDLVDLVVFAQTQDIGGQALRTAIVTEAHRRKMTPLTHFAVPDAWGDGYAKLSRSVSYCADYPTVDLATTLAAQLIDPALSGRVDEMVWSHSSCTWS